MSEATGATTDAIADLTNKIGELRKQFDDLRQNHLKPAAASAASIAKAALSDADRMAADQTERLAKRVKDSPLKALGLATVAGFAIASILR